MYFIGPVALGILFGVAASRFARHHRGHHHGFGGGCRARHGMRGPFGMGHRFGGPRRLFWLVRDLDLSAEQVRALKDDWLKGRGAVAQVRASGFEAAHAALGAALAEPFDRARIDDAARRHIDTHAQAARDLADAVSHAIEVLTPEQRAKLRERYAQINADPPARGGGGPAGGPYRDGAAYV
jgi:Spy/CpxP family protein refolding chaperone